MEKSLGNVVNECERGIEELDVAGRKMFDGLFMDHLYDRGWCWVNGIDYVNPNVGMAKERTYKGMVGSGLVKG